MSHCLDRCLVLDWKVVVSCLVDMLLWPDFVVNRWAESLTVNHLAVVNVLMWEHTSVNILMSTLSHWKVNGQLNLFSLTLILLTNFLDVDNLRLISA